MNFKAGYNEWYAAQTSKKIRAVWQTKADNGKRVSSTVLFGYMKAPNDKENWLIERIEVHNNDKSSGHCYVKVDIYFTAAGMIDIPTEQEILAMMEEIRENPQDFRFVA